MFNIHKLSCQEAKPAVHRQLTWRLGTVEPQMRSRLQQLSSALLEELAEAMLNFTTKAGLLTWLQAHQ